MATFTIKREAASRILEMLKDEGKVAAINWARLHTGCGLKEGKDWVEKGCPMGIFNGNNWVYEQPSVGELMARLFELTEEIAVIHRKLKVGDYREGDE